MRYFKFLTANKFRITTYWKGDRQYIISIPEEVADDDEIGYYVRGYRDAHHNLAGHDDNVFSDRRNYEVYSLGYYHFQLTLQY